MLPVTHLRWKEREERRLMGLGRRQTQRQAIMQSARWLIERLYVPCELSRHPWGIVVERVDTLTKPYKVSGEPINWGDLHVCDVRRLGRDGWLVEIEEADPNCPEFCGYIQHWLTAWGWENVEVRTEW